MADLETGNNLYLCVDVAGDAARLRFATTNSRIAGNFRTGGVASGFTPTVLGFYLLIILGAEGVIGRITESLGLGILPFTFGGWLSHLSYTAPFCGSASSECVRVFRFRPAEVAATLGAGPGIDFYRRCASIKVGLLAQRCSALLIPWASLALCFYDRRKYSR